MPPISFSLSSALDAIVLFHLNLSLFLSSSLSILHPKAMQHIPHRMIKRKQQSKIDQDIAEKPQRESINQIEKQ